MLIVGAKGFAKELLEILHQKEETGNLCFYDDVSNDSPKLLYEKFPILRSETEAKSYFENTDDQFSLGIGNPDLRNRLYRKFVNLGGKFCSIISKYSEIGSFGVEIGEGCNILSGVKISNDVKIGLGTLIYYNSVITHDVSIGDFCEISPSVNILGRVTIGNFTHLATGATIFPDVKIGNNVVVGAGSVVRDDIPDNTIVVGVPAKKIK